MSGNILDGKALAQELKRPLADQAQAVRLSKGRPPRLAILAGPQTTASDSYLGAKTKACAQCGIDVAIDRLSAGAGVAEALAVLERLNADASIDAIVIDLPLPKAVPPLALYGTLNPAKDAEGMSLANYGRLFMAKRWAEIEQETLWPPCTAEAVARLLLKAASPDALKGRRAAVVGRSPIVGRPAAQLLSLLDLTVTVCHTKTQNLAEEIGRADVVVACAGKARLIEGSWIKEGSIVIDAGINEEAGRLVGDVDFEAAKARAAWITPVPGGVGPVTTAVLLSRILRLAQK